MARIAKRAGGGTDTSRDDEYTDWDEVESFAAAFADVLD
jgi:menaquinone-dependent protoporphyrinogen oxidase